MSNSNDRSSGGLQSNNRVNDKAINDNDDDADDYPLHFRGIIDSYQDRRYDYDNYEDRTNHFIESIDKYIDQYHNRDKKDNNSINKINEKFLMWKQYKFNVKILANQYRISDRIKSQLNQIYDAYIIRYGILDFILNEKQIIEIVWHNFMNSQLKNYFSDHYVGDMINSLSSWRKTIGYIFGIAEFVDTKTESEKEQMLGMNSKTKSNKLEAGKDHNSSPQKLTAYKSTKRNKINFKDVEGGFGSGGPEQSLDKGCYVCGYFNHQAVHCRYTNHPDANLNPLTTFFMTQKGKIYEKLGRKLNHYKRLSLNNSHFIEYHAPSR